MKRKEYSLIDVFKLLFAIAVIIIHTQAYIKCSKSFIWFISALFTRLAVPFFMIASSFFLSNKIREKGLDVFKAYRKALWPKFLFWGTLNLSLHAIVWLKGTNNYLETILSIVQYFIFYPQGAMWFIWALIISSYILEYIYKSRVNLYIICFLTLGLFMFALFCNNYYFLVDNTPFGSIINQYMRVCITARNGLFLFIYTLIGYFSSSNKIKKLGKNKLVVFASLGYCLFIQRQQ